MLMAVDFQSLYVLASGLYYRNRKLEVISNNLANVKTQGFKKDLISAMAFPPKSSTEEDSVKIPNPTSPENPANNFLYPIVGKEKIDLTQGELIKTSSPFDFAIEGKGFFVVKTPDGRVLYTRNGHFLVDKEGFLITANTGYRVLDETGNEIFIAGNKQISVSKKGEIYANGLRIGKFKIVLLKDIKKFGNSFFIGKEAGTSTDYTILQGFLEGSNVNPIREMVDLIQNQRAYESYANAIKSLDRINSKVINETLRA